MGIARAAARKVRVVASLTRRLELETVRRVLEHRVHVIVAALGRGVEVVVDVILKGEFSCISAGDEGCERAGVVAAIIRARRVDSRLIASSGEISGEFSSPFFEGVVRGDIDTSSIDEPGAHSDTEQSSCSARSETFLPSHHWW
jgi:hypothetical protein